MLETSIVKAILIDNRRIELYWNKQVKKADDEENFIVLCNDVSVGLVAWKSDEEWDYGTVYQKEHCRTTLALSEEINVSEDKISVIVKKDVVGLDSVTADYGEKYKVTYEPYYTKVLKSRRGLEIKSGNAVRDGAVRLVQRIVDIMLEKMPEVEDKLVELGAAVSIYGLLESTYDIPEHRMGYWLATRHVEGYGGEIKNPISSVSESNVIRLRSGRYATMYPHELILVHEFAHAIHLVGMDSLEDKSLSNRIMKYYEKAKSAGLWPKTYAISNHEEYFATLTTIWFNVMQEGVNGKWDDIRGPVNTREELKSYDVDSYHLMEELYPTKGFPCPWDWNVDFYDMDGNLRDGEDPYVLLVEE